MVLHLFPIEKFTVDYVKKIHDIFGTDDQYFVLFGQNEMAYHVDTIADRQGIFITNTLWGNQKITEDLFCKSDLIVLHSLFFKIIDLFLLNSLRRKYNVKMSWVIWGKDLYEDYDKGNGALAYLLVKPIIKERVRRSLITNMHSFVTAGDYDALVKRYDIKKDAKIIGAQYTYNLLPLTDRQMFSDKLHVMVGHSATETCRHLETFNLLKKYSGKIKVYCPLSYPNDKDYISHITTIGKEWFGDDFYPMTQFMDYQEYVSFLNTMDIGVFNNSRQQGMGNITNLLYFGKKVYLSKDNTIRKSYEKNEYFIFDCDEIKNEDFLVPLNEEDALKNRNKIEEKFSDNNFYKEWRRVFES